MDLLVLIKASRVSRYTPIASAGPARESRSDIFKKSISVSLSSRNLIVALKNLLSTLRIPFAIGPYSSKYRVVLEAVRVAATESGEWRGCCHP